MSNYNNSMSIILLFQALGILLKASDRVGTIGIVSEIVVTQLKDCDSKIMDIMANI